MKIAVFLLLVMLSFSSIAQHQDKDKDFLLKKAKSFNTAAWICLGTGTAAIATGVIIPRGHLITETFWFVPAEYKNSDLKTALILGGPVSAIASLILFGKSSKYERKAMELSFKNIPGSSMVKNSISSINIPSLSLKLRL